MQQSDRKTAKHKLNSAHVQGALAVAGLLGLVTGSWIVFVGALAALVATAVHEGTIRMK